MRKIAMTLLVMLGVVLVWAVDTALTVWAWRSRNPRALRFIKQYHKHVINPVMLRFSGKHGVSAIVRHIGRRSGTTYATPVIAHQRHQSVIIPLPYGTDVDWLRNVLSAELAVVEMGGLSLRVDEPTVVAVNDVIDLLPAPMVRTVRLSGAREALRLRVAEPARAPA